MNHSEKQNFLMIFFVTVQIWVWRVKSFVNIFALESGSNVADSMDLDPKHCIIIWKIKNPEQIP